MIDKNDLSNALTLLGWSHENLASKLMISPADVSLFLADENSSLPMLETKELLESSGIVFIDTFPGVAIGEGCKINPLVASFRKMDLNALQEAIKENAEKMAKSAQDNREVEEDDLAVGDALALVFAEKAAHEPNIANKLEKR